MAMTIRNRCWIGLAVASLLPWAPVQADDIRPDSEARPFADERCIERCDTESDQCMQDAEGDSRKMEACDDEYTQCLRACDAS